MENRKSYYLVAKWQLESIEKSFLKMDDPLNAKNRKQYESEKKNAIDLMERIKNPAKRFRVNAESIDKLQRALANDDLASADLCITAIKQELEIREMKQFLFNLIETAEDDQIKNMFQSFAAKEKGFESRWKENVSNIGLKSYADLSQEAEAILQGRIENTMAILEKMK